MLGRLKGQFFIIFSLIFIIYFSILISHTFVEESLLKTRESLEAIIYRKIVENVENEERKIFIYFNSNSSFLEFIKNFTLYAREKFWLRNIKLRAIFLLAEYENIEANQVENLNVSLLNLFGNDLLNINLTFNKTSKTLTLLPDSKFFNTSFTFSISSNLDEKLILKYNDGMDRGYEINIPLRLNKSKKIGFWVIVLQGKDFEIRKDFFELN